MSWASVLLFFFFFFSFQMTMSVRQVATGVTTMLAVETSLAPISASATRASTETGTLVLVSKPAVCVCLFTSGAHQWYLCQHSACASSTWAHSTHQTAVLQECSCLQTSMSALWTTATVSTTAPTRPEGTAVGVHQATSWTRMDTTAQVKHSWRGWWSLQFILSPVTLKGALGIWSRSWTALMCNHLKLRTGLLPQNERFMSADGAGPLPWSPPCFYCSQGKKKTNTCSTEQLIWI